MSVFPGDSIALKSCKKSADMTFFLSHSPRLLERSTTLARHVGCLVLALSCKDWLRQVRLNFSDGFFFCGSLANRFLFCSHVHKLKQVLFLCAKAV